MSLRNRNPKIVKILGYIGNLQFRCKKCNTLWTPEWIENNRPGKGRLRRGSWQCPNGCKAD